MIRQRGSKGINENLKQKENAVDEKER